MEVGGVTGCVSEPGPTRREILNAATAATLGGTLSALSAGGAAAERVVPNSSIEGDGFEVERERATDVFPQSVASGGPTTSGALLWTRLKPNAYDPETPLGVEVAEDESFETTVYQGTIPPEQFGPKRDFTITVDVDGKLSPDNRYHYRFVHDGNASGIGRCRTLPKPDASPDSLMLAVASCNHYLQGYFGAFAHIADEDADFLVHLGDFIYEVGGDGIDDRSIDLPSDNHKANGLADYRHLYRTYRDDELLQRALREHTLIHTWDDHEVVNDRWWNYEADAPETHSHPRGDDPDFMRQLYVDAIRAYTEYVPVRARYEPENGPGLEPDALHENFQLYRSFSFGDLVDLLVTDERLYRSAPPAAEKKGAAVLAETAIESSGRTMLGDDQRRWFLEELTNSDAHWKLWANQVLAAALRFVSDGEVKVNSDAWDGYRRERKRILSQVADADVENFVTLTGDLHSYLAAYLQTNYELTAKPSDSAENAPNVGVEFMAPAISSDNLVEMGALPDSGTDTAVSALQAGNSHIEWFDSSHWGYAVVDIDREEAVYSAYSVDRSVDSPDAPKKLLRQYRVPSGSVEIDHLGETPENGME